MKRTIIYLIFNILFFSLTMAQNRLNEGQANRGNTHGNDSTETTNVPVEVHQWHVDERFGRVIKVDADTLTHSFQGVSLSEGTNGEYNHLGNMGSPRLSRIYFNRPENQQDLFIQPLDMFIRKPQDFFFTNTKSPFTNLSYLFAGDKVTGEDQFKSYFATNVNKKLGVGFLFDYMYGRGYYNSQSTSFFNGTVFASYLGDRYNMHLILTSYDLKRAENGGITNDKYITNPEDFSKKLSSSDIPTQMESTWNKDKLFSAFLTHNYGIGFYKDKIVDKSLLKKGENKKNTPLGNKRPDFPNKGEKPQKEIQSGSAINKIEAKNDKDIKMNPNDTIIREFVPVTRFIHTLKFETNKHRYISNEVPSNYYEKTYYSNDSIYDKTKYMSVKNTFGIELCEGFNKWIQSGLVAYISHELRSFNMPDTIAGTNPLQQSSIEYKENIIKIGGELSRYQGKAFHYRLLGETSLAGDAMGEFRLEGNANFNFKFLGDTLGLQARGSMTNLLPTFLYRHYHSQHLWWDNDNLSKEMRTRLEGIFTAKKLGTYLRIGVENVKNYTYLALNGNSYTSNGTTAWHHNVGVYQNTDNIQILSATLKQDLHVGVFHWDNEVTYQKSSNKDVLPLPNLSVYSNLYLKGTLVKNVLKAELGADVRYFSKYYAPDYSSAIGSFALQNSGNKMEIGNYPIVNAYVNVEWKHTRFYLMFYHVNSGSGNREYFLAPHYPINPRVLKLGISWNFYN